MDKEYHVMKITCNYEEVTAIFNMETPKSSVSDCIQTKQRVWKGKNSKLKPHVKLSKLLFEQNITKLVNIEENGTLLNLVSTKLIHYRICREF